MKTNEMKLEMKQLIEELNIASEAYYNSSEIMSNKEWDAKFDRLSLLEQQSGIILPNSPTANVSSSTEADEVGVKVTHEFPALSLDKTKSIAKLIKWADNKDIWLSWKLDGSTIICTYDNGNLTLLATRGTKGLVGIDRTYLAPAIKGVPLEIPYKGHLVVRGECLISYADFDSLIGLPEFEEAANARNLASGSLTLLDVEECKKRKLQFKPFTLVYLDTDKDPQPELVSWGKRMQFLETQGFSPVDREIIPAGNSSSIDFTVEKWTKIVEEGKCEFPVDGLVICYDDTEYAKTGSVTGHHATRAGYAFKWQDEEIETTLDHIEWSCGTTVITPVAVFKPVQLEGTTVARASLHNLSIMDDLCDKWKSGNKLMVYKANKIIPQISTVEENINGDLIIPPDVCPVCGAKTEVVISASGAKVLKCTNCDCPAKQLKKFTRFVSKDAMDIDGLSVQTIDTLINLGWVSDFTDIYRIAEHADELATIEGFGKKSVTKLLKSIETSKDVDAAHFLYSLCIPMLGHDASKKILGEVKTMDKFIDAIDADHTGFDTIDGIGPEKTAAIETWFADSKNRLLFDRLIEIVTIKDVDQTPTGNNCAGLTFVITGDVHHYKNRDELKAYIESQGGKTSGSVSAKTSFLINNDVESTSGKNKKAKELNIPIISEDEFVAKYC